MPAPGRSPDYQACLDAFPALERAKVTPQEPRYHGEGDVWTHTMMVIDELLDLADYQAAALEDRESLFFAALLHDIAKADTTVIDPMPGVIGQPGHSRRGAQDARIALWDAGTPFAQREAVCRLIAVHQLPFHALSSSRRGRSIEFIVRELSWQLSVPMLAALAEADMRGRICVDKEKVLDDIELFREAARIEGCYGRARPFADAYTRVAYFRGADVPPDYSLFHEPGPKVTVMCGLPATGKDTWVAKHRANLAIVSFNDARRELGLRHGQNEGMVAHRAIDKAKELLRQKRDFVWCATHVSVQMREKTIQLLLDYGAEVEVVYLEAPRNELLRRNTKRDTSLTNRALEAMAYKLEVPTPVEAHERCATSARRRPAEPDPVLRPGSSGPRRWGRGP